MFNSSEMTEEEIMAQRNSKVLSSYSLDLKAVIQTNRVQNIIDLQFLHGYNQPTLAILYEPLQTFSGRIAVRKDTCRLDVLTLDVKERVSAFIWSREILPFDCVKILSVPKPIGGILVFSVNALFFLNQGIPPYAVSLNSLGDTAMEGIASEYPIHSNFQVHVFTTRIYPLFRTYGWHQVDFGLCTSRVHYERKSCHFTERRRTVRVKSNRGCYENCERVPL